MTARYPADTGALASQLIQIHSQHETLDLSTSRFQFLMLDALAGHQELLKQYEDTFGNWKQVLAEIQEQENRLLRAKADELPSISAQRNGSCEAAGCYPRRLGS